MNPILYAKHERPDSSTPLFDIATPEEIKASHPTCGSCKHIFIYESHDAPPFCDNDASAIQYSNVNPDTDYCNHHEPKET